MLDPHADVWLQGLETGSRNAAAQALSDSDALAAADAVPIQGALGVEPAMDAAALDGGEVDEGQGVRDCC